MTLMAKIRLMLPELVLAALFVLCVVNAPGVVIALAALLLLVAAGIAAEELVYRYSRRQGRHGHRLT